MDSEGDGFSDEESKESAVERARLGPPERWLYCPPIGSVIAQHFLPFKTPLSKLYDDQMGTQYHFHPRDVFSHKFVGGKPGARIGLWIDLTKTNRYYNKKEVEKKGCIYKKMPMQGHGESPTEAETSSFCRTVRTFLQGHPNDIIAIHCTHGFNRTGFLIAAYLAKEMDWAVDAAIRAFAKGRPDGIYKQLYLDDLVRRYGDEEDHVQAPPRPGWENGPTDANDELNNSSHGATTSNSNLQDEPKFMNGDVPGVTYVSDPITRSVLQDKIREMCSFKWEGFPGCQPVSMECSRDRNNLKFLAEKRYMVSWKADGIRYMVLIDNEDSIFAFDRDNNVFRIAGVTFPHRKEARHVRDTLIDCEMIIEKINEHEKMPRLLIFDIIKFEGIDVGACKFNTRRQCIDLELIGPRIKAMKEGRIRRDDEPMSIRKKEFWELEAVRKLFDDKFTKSVGHEIDGLIFQPVEEPYHPGRCDTLLKWKPPSMNSIDFKLSIKKVCKPGELSEHVGFLYVQHENEPMATMKATKKLQPFDGKIIECTYQNGKWEFMRERTDKSLPNSVKTAKAVYNSIIYPIHKEMLIDFVERNCLPKCTKRLRVANSDESTGKRGRC